jgi:hypothetical protein
MPVVPVDLGAWSVYISPTIHRKSSGGKSEEEE